MTIYTLKFSCPDQMGIVATVAQGILDLRANILNNAEFREPSTNTFCMRSVFETDTTYKQIHTLLSERTKQFSAKLSIRNENHKPRTLVLLSREEHCLVDLLHRQKLGELPIKIPLVVSNHEMPHILKNYPETDFEQLHVTPKTKKQAEQNLHTLIQNYAIDFVVLARYMQILSADFCEQYAGKILNIHHSFLPGFKGANPYQQAWERGVKIIGSTAHYATKNLDEGPILSQQVTTVTHEDTAESMRNIGRDLERITLAQAVKAHAQNRVFLLGNRTVIL